MKENLPYYPVYLLEGSNSSRHFSYISTGKILSANNLVEILLTQEHSEEKSGESIENRLFKLMTKYSVITLFTFSDALRQ